MMILEESLKKIIHKNTEFLYTDQMKDAEQFKKEREEQWGGKIEYLSYVTLIGRASAEKVANKGGLLYLIHDTLYFEDFESTGGLMVLFNQKVDYTKTEFSIDLKDITIVKEVKEKNAAACVCGFMDEQEILPFSGGLFTLFSKSVIQIIINNQPSVFFDILNKDDFKEMINQFMLRSE